MWETSFIFYVGLASNGTWEQCSLKLYPPTSFMHSPLSHVGFWFSQLQFTAVVVCFKPNHTGYFCCVFFGFLYWLQKKVVMPKILQNVAPTPNATLSAL